MQYTLVIVAFETHRTYSKISLIGKIQVIPIIESMQYLQPLKEVVMRNRNMFLSTIIAFTLSLMLVAANVLADDELNSEKIMAEIEKQMDLSREKWEQLKPLITEKSEELSKQVQDSVDKGFSELDALTKKIDAMSQDAETKVKDILTSEEAMKFREQLKKIDKQAIEKAKNDMVADLNALLDLTEEQAEKLKPVLEESFKKMSDMILALQTKGTEDWEKFKKEFGEVTGELYDKVQETLDGEQMEKLEEYNNQQQEEIKRTLFRV